MHSSLKTSTQSHYHRPSLADTVTPLQDDTTQSSADHGLDTPKKATSNIPVSERYIHPAYNVYAGNINQAISWFLDNPSIMHDKKHSIDHEEYSLKYIASGSFCHIFRYRDKGNRPPSEIIFKFLKSNQFEETVTNEIKTLKKLSSHPHIIRLIASFHYQATAICLESCVTDLNRYLKDHYHTMTEEMARKIVMHGTRGLVYLKEQGIIHCDIKPGNILLDTQGNWKWGDFGLAHHYSVYVDVIKGFNILPFS